VGQRGVGALLIGPSGAGKSTLSLHAFKAGMQLLSEDSAFVAADGLCVTGVPNFLHVQPSALRFLRDGPLLRQIRASPTIRRRSGTRKYELNLREIAERGARAPLRLAATVFLSPRPAGYRPLLRRLGSKTLLSRLRHEQPYAAGLPTWQRFERRIVAVPAYELRRPEHPDIAVGELQKLLAGTSKLA
jgi:energy-coupling factor transporter ATP-binding protein EcfA2